VFDSVLIANRGEIAARVIRTAQRLGVRACAVYSDADAELPYVRAADDAARLGPPSPRESYLDADRVLAAATELDAQAIHPGYGFLSENAEFAHAVADAGLVWIGPSPEAITAMGDKINARNLVSGAGVPVAPGTAEPVDDAKSAAAQAASIGYPVMVKASAGGGGIGMTIARDQDQLAVALATTRSRAERFFGSADVLLERYVERARHVEVQILGLADGRVIALGERDCSVQRRHQKVAEETPCPALTPALRESMCAAAVQAGRAVAYRGAGTVEFLLDPARSDFFFLEMNTRLQVEHPITELITGVDLVEAQFRVAAGEPVDIGSSPGGHAIEFRVYAEDPKRFLPSPGPITRWEEPAGQGIRVDSGYAEGNTVTPHYDPLLAKLCVHGRDRPDALSRARHAVAEFAIEGLKTNLSLFTELLDNPEFIAGDYDTGLIARMRA
jgi:acetyl-CoA carboxylase biotin carboxylase subunit